MEQTRQRTQQRPQNPRPRRKKRRAPVRELAICAAVIFVAGFLMGFLIRGAFIPKEEKPAETTLPPVETTTEPKAQPPVPLDDWRLVLVNAANPLPEDYSVSMTQLSDGLQVDKRCYSDLQAMLNACTGAGLVPRLESAYRDWAQQNERFDQEMARLVAEGMNHAQAEKETAKTVAEAGCSEHHLGLAVDIIDTREWSLEQSQEDLPAQQWLMKNCWKYGFILRYPDDKIDITGIIYEPWHYRYVGLELAEELHNSGLTLEEYIDSLD